MELFYKPNWEKTKQNYLAWWNHEYFGRCAIDVTAPKNDKNGKPPSLLSSIKTRYEYFGSSIIKTDKSENNNEKEPPPLPDKIENRWLDFDYLTAINEYELQRTFFGAEALPIWYPGYPGCDTHAVHLGCKVTLLETTGWVDPIIEDGEIISHDFHKLNLNKNSRWWKFGCDVRKLAVEKSKDRCLPGNMAIGGCGDTLASIRGTNQLLIDVLDYPDYVRDFELHLMRQWIEIYENSYNITCEGAEGSTCWFPVWSPGKFYATHNDFAYMISPEMFVEIFLPALEIQTDYLDHAAHHLDGIGNFKHLDALLELKKLQTFQIAPGAGKPNALYYIDILKKVQNAGRNLYISLPPGEIKHALDELSARGLFIQTYCDTEDEARDLIKCAEKWSVDRG